jgi:hypothetical protein
LSGDHINEPEVLSYFFGESSPERTASLAQG